MKKRVSILSYLIAFCLLVFLSFQLVFAQDNPEPEKESCFVSFSVNELFDDETNTTSFSLAEQRNLYGFYSGGVHFYSPETKTDYLLNVFDLSSQTIGKYPLDSSRFIVYENFGAECDPEVDSACALEGVIETESGVISVVMPYSENIARVVIENNKVSEGLENGAFQNELGIDASQIKCERTCKIEGEMGVYSIQESCCLGFSKIQTADDSFVCSKCGDGVCSSYESELGCFEDCGADVVCSSGYVKSNYGCVPGAGKVREIISSIISGESSGNILNSIKGWLGI